MHPHKKNSFLSIFEEYSKRAASSGDEEKGAFPTPEGVEMENELFSLTDELDHEIVMHRDAHFGGDFGVMLDYYQDEGVGAHPDFELNRIAYLAQIEAEMGEDLAPLILGGAEAERVARARRAYEKLKELYESESEAATIPRLLADLILAEEERPEKEIAAVVAQGTRILPELLTIIRSDEAYDTLFPGYGYAPYLAILCLGEIKDPEAVAPLFEILGKETLFGEEVILGALRRIGEEAKHFLLDLLKGRPLTEDNTSAAYALTAFGTDPEVAKISFEQLQDREVLKTPLLRTYLVCNCEALKNTPLAEPFIAMGQKPEVPKELREEIQQIVRDWH